MWHAVYRRYFRCPICGTVNTATKRSDRRTPRGHKKKLWCWKCQKVVNQVQISR